MPRIARDLGPFLLITSDDTLSLVLETLSVVVEVDGSKWLIPELANTLVLAILEVWAKNNKGRVNLSTQLIANLTYLYAVDPIFLSILTDILGSLASSSASGVYEAVVKQALPTLCHAIAVAKADESWVAGSAIDLVGGLVSGAPESGLGEGFFPLLAPSLFKCLQEAEDRDVLQVNRVDIVSYLLV